MNQQAKEFCLNLVCRNKDVNEINVEKLLATADKVYEWYVKGLDKKKVERNIDLNK